jgi:CAAX protease family protein
MNEQWEIHQTEPPLQRIRLLEVGVFLFLILPSMLLSAPIARTGTLNFPFIATVSMLQDIALLSLILFFLYRNAEGWQSLGLTARNGVRELLVGILLFIPFTFIVRLISHALQWAGISLPQEAPRFLIPNNPAQTMLAIVFLIVVAVTEEVLFRGYLLLRFRQLIKTPPRPCSFRQLFFRSGTDTRVLPE